MKSYLIYFSLIWALVIILMGLFVRFRHKHHFSEDEDQ